MREPDLDELIRWAREHDRPDSARAARILEGALARGTLGVVESGVRSQIETASEASGSSLGPLGNVAPYAKWGAALLVVGASGVALLAGPWSSARETSRAPSSEVGAHAAQPIDASAGDSAGRETSQAAPAPAPDREVGGAREATRETSSANAAPHAGATKARPAPSSAQRQDHLEQELGLVRGAKLALDAGEPRRALAMLDEYERRFPKGSLQGEARAARVLALCALGDGQRARSVAAGIDPKSPLGKRMQAGCPER